MQTKTLETLFHDTLKDIYYAEAQILKALPRMIAAASSPDLKEGLTAHRKETEGQVKRLDLVFAQIGKKPQAKTCPAIDGILKEGGEVMEEDKGSPALDAALAAAAQTVEHYEIARYGALCTWADLLGHAEANQLLSQTLEQEMAADKALSTVAVTVNQMAMAAE